MKKEFGAFIKDKREKKQISVRKFSRQVGISAEYLSKIENGLRAAPKDDILERIADKLILDEGETEIFFDLAAESKTNLSLASDLVVYINENEVVHKLLRLGKRCNIKTEDWQKFLDALSEKYL